MALKIGIPQALLYYKHFPLWSNFFENLGAQVVLSEPTDRKILNDGLEVASSEICLPVKVFYGHVLNLRDKVDMVFLPRMVSVEGTAYTCPKFLGLPDMLKAVEGAPKILTANFNQKLKKREFYKAVYEVGSYLTKNPFRIYRAYKKAEKSLKEFEHSLNCGLTPVDILKEPKNNKYPKPSIKLGVVGHPYNLYDDFCSLNLIERLRRGGAQVQTLEMINPKILKKEAETLSKDVFWSYEKEVVGAVLYWLRNKNVDGIVYLLSFACGPDSLMQTVIEDQARKSPDIPLMSLVIDEHSAEAGIQTRIEAFLDMIKRSKSQAHKKGGPKNTLRVLEPVNVRGGSSKP